MAVVVGEVAFKSNKEDVMRILNEDVIAWLEGIGEDAADTAAKKAPVDTGRLKGSISHAVVPDERAVYIGTNVHNEQGKNYAIYQELGTSKIAGKHFLQFGATAHKREYANILVQLMES